MKAVLDYLNAIIGIVSLIIAVVTLWKVQSVRRAQNRERELLQSLYGTDALANQLRAAATHLAKSRTVASRELAEGLLRACGQIEGVTRALKATSQQGDSERAASIVIRENGYFTQEFLHNLLSSASNTVDILIFRPMVISTGYVMRGLRDAANRGARIRLLSLSSTTPDSVLLTAATFMPWDQIKEATSLRTQLEECENRIRNHAESVWPQADRARFSYRTYQTPPSVHMIRVDSITRLGFVHLRSSTTPPVLEDRTHAEIATTSKLGTHLQSHFELLWQQSPNTILGPTQ